MKLVIYDFDGVLVDSVNAIVRYYDKFFEHVGLISPNWKDAAVLSKVRGMSFDQFVSAFVPEYCREQFCSYSPQFTFEEMADATPLQPEAAVVIPDVSAKHTLAICTNRNTPVDDILDYHGIAKYFSLIITSAEAEPKPSPDGLNKILHNFGEKRALYIGDSEVDYEAAQNAGIDFLGYKTDIEGINRISKHSEIYKYLW
ncbi:MAG: HAD family hydrolase [Deferribacteraceae bacterium]|jgi:phosphoglycolate phosphatase|nr:HAD family hydrolase [Deferribacteraceae bacterium]